MTDPRLWMPTVRAVAFPCDYCETVWDNRISSTMCCDPAAFGDAD